MQQLPLEQKVELVVPYLQRAGLVAGAGSGEQAGPVPRRASAKIEHVVRPPATASRPPATSSISPISSLPTTSCVYDEKAVAKSLQKPGAAELLAKFRDQLAAAEPFDAQPLEQMTHAFVEAEGVKIGDIVHALRAAVTGQSVGLGLFDSLAILGKASCLATDRADADDTWRP